MPAPRKLLLVLATIVLASYANAQSASFCNAIKKVIPAIEKNFAPIKGAAGKDNEFSSAIEVEGAKRAYVTELGGAMAWLVEWGPYASRSEASAALQETMDAVKKCDPGFLFMARGSNVRQKIEKYVLIQNIGGNTAFYQARIKTLESDNGGFINEFLLFARPPVMIVNITEQRENSELSRALDTIAVHAKGIADKFGIIRPFFYDYGDKMDSPSSSENVYGTTLKLPGFSNPRIHVEYSIVVSFRADYETNVDAANLDKTVKGLVGLMMSALGKDYALSMRDNGDNNVEIGFTNLATLQRTDDTIFTIITTKNADGKYTVTLSIKDAV